MLDIFIKDALFNLTEVEGDGLNKQKHRRLQLDMGGVIR